MDRAIALKTLVGQLLRFGLVGGFVTALGVVAITSPATCFGVAPLLANLSAIMVAVTFGYVLHSRISFKGHGSRDNPVAAHGPLLHRLAGQPRPQQPVRLES